jgi:hypothetical protein
VPSDAHEGAMVQFHGFRKNKGVVKRDKIQIELIKLTGGERMLRLSDIASGLAIEKKLDPQLSVNRQKEGFLRFSKRHWLDLS